MTIPEATLLGREALLMALVVGGPPLLATMIVGTFVSLLQAITQVHENTLTFLPKLLAVCGVFAVAAGWMATEMTTFADRCFERAATISK